MMLHQARLICIDFVVDKQSVLAGSTPSLVRVKFMVVLATLDKGYSRSRGMIIIWSVD